MQQNKARRPLSVMLAVIALVLLFIFGLQTVISFFSTSALTIKTSENARIIVEAKNFNNNERVLDEEDTNTTKVRAKKGTYIITAATETSTIQRFVTLQDNQDISIAFPSKNPSSFRAANATKSDKIYYTNNSGVAFIDKTNGALMVQRPGQLAAKIISSQVLNVAYLLGSVNEQWLVITDEGDVQTVSSDGKINRLYLLAQELSDDDPRIVNRQVVLENALFDEKTNTIFLSKGKSLYSLRIGQNRLNKVADIDLSSFQLSVGGGKVFAFKSFPDQIYVDNDNNDEQTYNHKIIDITSAKISDINAPLILAAGISPDGQHLAYSDGLTTKVLNFSNNSVVRETTSAENIAWKNRASVGLVVENQAWLYDLNTSTQIAIGSYFGENVTSMRNVGDNLLIGATRGIFVVGQGGGGRLVDLTTSNYSIATLQTTTSTTYVISTFAPLGSAGTGEEEFTRLTNKYREEATTALQSAGVNTSSSKVIFIPDL